MDMLTLHYTEQSEDAFAETREGIGPLTVTVSVAGGALEDYLQAFARMLNIAGFSYVTALTAHKESGGDLTVDPYHGVNS